MSAALSVLLLLLSDDIPVTGNGRLPSEVAGTWDVVRVAVDNQDASHWGSVPNDPRLLGRTLTIDPVQVQFEDGKELGCKPVGSGQLALHYDNQVLLLFQRRPPGSKPTASFDCAKAASSTERTICASFDLASWDRSVAQAWRAALDRRPQKQAHFRKTQKEWLHARDACGYKADCLDDLQWRRVDELTQE